MNIGQTISHYKITGKLGSGGMGVVYMAEDLRLHRIVALKFLPSELSCNEEAKQRFMLEAQTASSFKHDNICTIHEIDETQDGQIFICMDCYEGEALDKKIERSKLNENEIINIIFQIASGLQKAHQKGIVHRDIKPSNIFLTTENEVKILDFGLAKFSGHSMLTKSGATIGTIAYMSPEQTRGDAVDQRTDVWSLGVLFYQLITGELPFRGDYDQAIIYSIMNQEPEPVSKLNAGASGNLDMIILKCIAKEPSERYQTMDELLSDLNNLKKGEMSSSAVTVPAVKGKILSGRKIYYLLALAILMTAASVLLFFKSSSVPSDRKRAIAVLPFHPISNSEEDIGFSEGIHDDILTQLSKIRNMQVIARTSVMQYKNTNKTIKEIASELGVGSILEGSTRRSGNTIRVTAQLIDAETEKHIWAESYDRLYGDIFAIQSDVAQKIASALQINLAGDERRSIETQDTKNLQAYEYFQKGKFYWNSSFDYTGNLKAAEMFEQACKLDTAFTLALAYQSMAYGTVLSDLPVSVNYRKNEFVKKTENSLKKALELSPGMHEVLMAKGSYLFLLKDDKKGALQELEKANTVRPNNIDVLYLMSVIYSILGDAENSLRIDSKIYELNPKWSPGISSLSWDNFYLHRYKEAEKWADLFISTDPESGEGYGIKLRAIVLGAGNLRRGEEELQEAAKFIRTNTYYSTMMKYMISLYKRDYSNALSIIKNWEYRERFILRTIALRALNRNDEAKLNFDSARVSFSTEELNHNELSRIPFSLATALAGAGEKEKALNELNRMDPSLMTRYYLDRAYIYILLGKNKEAVKCLQGSVTKPYDMGLSMLKLDPRLDPIRNDPGFVEIIKKVDSIL